MIEILPESARETERQTLLPEYPHDWLLRTPRRSLDFHSQLWQETNRLFCQANLDEFAIRYFADKERPREIIVGLVSRNGRFKDFFNAAHDGLTELWNKPEAWDLPTSEQIPILRVGIQRYITSIR